MNRFIIYCLILLVSLGSVTSCEDYLEGKSKSSFTDDVIFSNSDLTKDAVMAIYDVLGENNSYRNRMLGQMGFNTDIEYREGWSGGVKKTNENASDQIALYAAESTLGDNYNNSDAANPWSRIYQAIERANLAIAGIRKYGNPSGNADMAHLLGESLGMRAFFYYDLVKWWGDVPFRTDPVNDENLYAGKTDRDIIYNRLIEDLDEAIKLMYNSGAAQTSTTKRLSREAVRGLRARIALSAAGYSMRPSGTNDAVIKITVSDERRKELYQIAREECRVIIREGKYSLDGDFANIFYEQCQDINTPGREVIFQLPFNHGVRGRFINGFGLPRVAENSTPADATFNSYDISCNFRVMPSFFYDFDVHDSRRDASIVPYSVKKSGAVMEQQFTDGIIGFRPAKWRAEYYKGKVTGTDDGVSPIILRYADVLLMFAEADLFLGGNEGKEYFNQVRRRAFGSSAYDLDLTLDNIKKERAFELMGENIRKYDLIRWGELKSGIETAKQNLRDLRDGKNSYASVPAVLYYRYKVATNMSPGERVLEIYGLNRGETDNKTITDPSGGWVEKTWTQEASNGVLRLADSNLQYMYWGDPDKKQLLPIMHQIIVDSQGTLSNNYGYQN